MELVNSKVARVGRAALRHLNPMEAALARVPQAKAAVLTTMRTNCPGRSGRVAITGARAAGDRIYIEVIPNVKTKTSETHGLPCAFAYIIRNISGDIG
jgi:hypothetical protein